MSSTLTMPGTSTPSLQINPYATVTINRPLLFTRKIAAIMNENAPDSFRFVVCDDEKILGSGFGGFSRMARVVGVSIGNYARAWVATEVR